MTPAGSPASPQSEADAPVAQRPSSPPGAGSLTAFEQFMLDAPKRRKKQHKDEKKARRSGGRPQDWADPDPKAALRLDERSHPVRRVLARCGEKYHRELTCALRVNLEVIQGQPIGGLPVQAVFDFPWHQLSVDDAADFRRELRRRYPKQSTRNDKTSLVRRVIIQCHRTGLITALRRDLLLDELYTVAPGRSNAGRALTNDEVERLMHACATTGSVAARARNTAMVAVFRASGARVSEIVKLELADWDVAQMTLTLRETKNGQDHTVYLHPVAAQLLEDWAEIRGQQPGPLFSNLNHPHAPDPLHPFSVRYMLRRRAAAAGVAPFGSHDFRRTFASDMLMRYDAALVSKLLNHKKLDSTLVYDRRGDDAQRAAVAAIDLPGAPGKVAA